MVFDTDKFISIIQNNPSIWEMGSKDYMNKTIKQKSWNTIGECMYENWSELEESVKEIKVKDMKTKWRHIRDHYTKFLNQGKSGDGAKKKKYVYAESLSFLQHTIKKRKTMGNFNEIETENLSLDDEEFSNTIDSDDIDIANPINSPTVLNKTKMQKKRKNTGSITDFQQHLLDSLNKPDDSDPDKAFLYSLLPDYKKLNYEQKTDFRLLTLQFFKNISLQNNQSKSLLLHQNPHQTQNTTSFQNQPSFLYSPYNVNTTQPYIPQLNPQVPLPPYETIFNLPVHNQNNNSFMSSASPSPHIPHTSEQS